MPHSKNGAILCTVQHCIPPVIVYDVYMAVYIIIDGEDKETSLSLSETAELQQKIQDLHKLHLSQRQEIVQRDTQIEQLVSSVANSDCLNK